MPELPEVETVRRMLSTALPGRRIVQVEVSRQRLRSGSLSKLPGQLTGRAFGVPRRIAKFLLLDLDEHRTLLSHLGMSGRWLWWPDIERADASMPHVHLRLRFADGAALWYQDTRRFGLLRVVPTERLTADPSLANLGPDAVADPRTGADLHAASRGARVAVKNFLLDQRRLSGVGNIYASESLFRSAIDPRRRAGTLTLEEWSRVAAELLHVLEASIARMGTTFSTFRTVWNESGQYGDQLLVYDRGGQPCRRCATPLKRIVQTGRSTFFCPNCQRKAAKPTGARAGRAPRGRKDR